VSHSLLLEVKHDGVRVSLIQPGLIDTRFGGGTSGSRNDPAAAPDPSDLAAAILRAILRAIDTPNHISRSTGRPCIHLDNWMSD
jgi:short-subunit dehydrogenase